MRHKFKYFDNETGKFFQEDMNKEHSKQLLLTQNGELMYVETINNVVSLTHEKDFPIINIGPGVQKPKFEKIQYTGIRDVNEVKFYIGDVAKVSRQHDAPKFYEVIWFYDRLGLRDKDGAEYETHRMELRQAENVGSIHEFPNILTL